MVEDAELKTAERGCNGAVNIVSAVPLPFFEVNNLKIIVGGGGESSFDFSTFLPYSIKHRCK